MKTMITKDMYYEYGKEYTYTCGLKTTPFHLRTLCRTLKKFMVDNSIHYESEFINELSDKLDMIFDEVEKRCNVDTAQNELDMRIGIVRIMISAYAEDDNGVYSQKGWRE